MSDDALAAEFIPTEDELSLAQNLMGRFLRLGRQGDRTFRWLAKIAWKFYNKPRLLKALDYDSLYQFCANPQVKAALRMDIHSERQMERFLEMAEGVAKYPHLPWDEIEHFSIVYLPPGNGMPSLSSRIRDLARVDAPEEKALEVFEEFMENRPIHIPRRDTSPNETLALINGVEVQRGRKSILMLAHGWYKHPALVRIVNRITHLEEQPGVTIEGGVIKVFSNNQVLTLGNINPKARPSDIELLKERTGAREIKNI